MSSKKATVKRSLVSTTVEQRSILQKLFDNGLRSTAKEFEPELLRAAQETKMTLKAVKVRINNMRRAAVEAAAMAAAPRESDDAESKQKKARIAVQQSKRTTGFDLFKRIHVRVTGTFAEKQDAWIRSWNKLSEEQRGKYRLDARNLAQQTTEQMTQQERAAALQASYVRLVKEARLLSDLDISGEMDMLLVIQTPRGLVDVSSGRGDEVLATHWSTIRDWLPPQAKSSPEAPSPTVPRVGRELPKVSAKERMRSLYLAKLQDALDEFAGHRVSGFNIGKVLPEALAKLGAVMEGLPGPIVNLKELRKEYFQAVMGADIRIVKATTKAFESSLAMTKTRNASRKFKSPVINGPVSLNTLPAPVQPTEVTHMDILGQTGTLSQNPIDSVAIVGVDGLLLGSCQLSTPTMVGARSTMLGEDNPLLSTKSPTITAPLKFSRQPSIERFFNLTGDN